MGGKVAVLVRKKNGDKVSFKTFTGSIASLFDDSDVLNEQRFFERLARRKFKTKPAENLKQHYDYENNASLFAPFHYGLLLIDNVEKTIHSCHNFCGFMEYTSEFFMNELQRHYMGDEPVSLKDLDREVDESEVIGDMKLTKVMRECNNYASSLNFNLREKDIEVTCFSDLVKVILTNEGIEFDESDIRCAIKSHYDKKRHDEIVFGDFLISPKEWKIHLGDGSAEYVSKAFKHCQEHSLLTELDEIAWNDYFEECRKYEGDD
ncbi:MAG: hypothetical protein RSG77_21830 [Hafnia sp.]